MSNQGSKNVTRRVALVAGGLGAAGLATIQGRRDAGNAGAGSQPGSGEGLGRSIAPLRGWSLVLPSLKQNPP